MPIFVLADVMTGGLIGAFVGLLVAIVMYFVAMGVQKKGGAMGKPTISQLSWTGDYRAGLNAARQAMERAGGVFIKEDSTAGLVIGKTKANLMTFGCTIRVQFYGQAGNIRVELSVAQTMQAVDYGKSKAFIAEFERHWFALGGSSPSAPPAPQ